MTKNETGDWMPQPSVEAVSMFATPFPDFDRAGDWQVDAAVHNMNAEQLRRFEEAEQ